MEDPQTKAQSLLEKLLEEQNNPQEPTPKQEEQENK
jgi:hypothetical protein